MKFILGLGCGFIFFFILKIITSKLVKIRKMNGFCFNKYKCDYSIPIGINVYKCKLFNKKLKNRSLLDCNFKYGETYIGYKDR